MWRWCFRALELLHHFTTDTDSPFWRGPYSPQTWCHNAYRVSCFQDDHSLSDLSSKDGKGCCTGAWLLSSTAALVDDSRCSGYRHRVQLKKKVFVTHWRDSSVFGGTKTITDLSTEDHKDPRCVDLSTTTNMKAAEGHQNINKSHRQVNTLNLTWDCLDHHWFVCLFVFWYLNLKISK